MQYTNNILGILTVITIIIEVLLKYAKLEIFYGVLNSVVLEHMAAQFYSESILAS